MPDTAGIGRRRMTPQRRARDVVAEAFTHNVEVECSCDPPAVLTLHLQDGDPLVDLVAAAIDFDPFNPTVARMVDALRRAGVPDTELEEAP